MLFLEEFTKGIGDMHNLYNTKGELEYSFPTGKKLIELTWHSLDLSKIIFSDFDNNIMSYYEKETKKKSFDYKELLRLQIEDSHDNWLGYDFIICQSDTLIVTDDFESGSKMGLRYFMWNPVVICNEISKEKVVPFLNEKDIEMLEWNYRKYKKRIKN